MRTKKNLRYCELLANLMAGGWGKKELNKTIEMPWMGGFKDFLIENKERILLIIAENESWSQNLEFRQRLFDNIKCGTRQGYVEMINDKNQPPAFRAFLLFHLDRMLDVIDNDMIKRAREMSGHIYI